MSYADRKRKQICVAETGMPNLIALRKEYARQRLLAGARIALHVRAALSERPVAREK